MIACLLGLLGVYDDANWVAFGGAGAFVPHKTIHMLGEDVNIELFDEKIHVRVYFSFENRGEATNVKMAFPFEGTKYEDWFTLYRFSTKVDGEPVAVEKVPMPTFTSIGKDFAKYENSPAAPFALVKEVSFEKNQRRAVLVDYIVKRGFAGAGWAIDSYVLHTGATWAGKIGQCTFTVDWSKEQKQGKPDLVLQKLDDSVVPHKWTFTEPRVATTTLTDFEPDFDLSLRSVEDFWHVTLNGKTLTTERGSHEDGGIFDSPWSDPLVYVECLSDFFGESYSEDRNVILGQVPNAFGNALQLISKTQLKDGLGKLHELRRPAIGAEPEEYQVRLKDVVEALGGTFKWVPEWERIDITMPTRDKPVRKPGDPIPPDRT